MKTKMVLVLLMVVISGCYRPNWYRANTTYAVLKADSEWCKNQTNLGAARTEMIEQYEKCMTGKGYQLKGKDPYSDEPYPTKNVEQYKDATAIDKRAKVYVGIYSGGLSSQISMHPAYRYFHKKDCKQLWSVSTEEITVGEAIARGKSMCPDCFRD